MCMLNSERANQSIQQLSSALQQLDPDEEQAEEVRGGSEDCFTTTMAEEDKAAWSQKSQSEAGDSVTTQKVSSQEGKSSLPAFQDLVPVFHKSEYIQHLEAEVKFCKEELEGMKQRIRVVVVENEKLHSELKARAVDESLKDYTIRNSMVIFLGSNVCTHQEKLKVIYQAQMESLEAQVIALRKDLSVSQRECEEVKLRLRHREKQAADALRADGAPRVAGLCLKCAQHEAVLAGTHTNLHVQAIDRLTKERDELLVALRTVRASQQEAQQREWSACLQVKQAVEMAEEANLQKARVRETHTHTHTYTHRFNKVIFQLPLLLTLLYVINIQNTSNFTLHFLIFPHLLSSSISAGQEVERLSSELVGCRQHLEAVQKDGSQWQAEALSLAEQLANAQPFPSLITVGELDGLLSSQNSLLGKLNEECCNLGTKLEELAKKSRSLEQLALEKQHLEETVKNLRARCCDMEEQCVQHGRMHQRMKDRLQQLDRHCQSSAQQVCELLAKQNQLMQERNTLSEEMQSLRIEVRTHRAECVCVRDLLF
uniref:SHH signaling and ciliogenesis regulator sdccag8 n=1 Tax=Amphilophus citrinellus TaxID=61819 RepID=A0A3Q0RLE7_AMPCI